MERKSDIANPVAQRHQPATEALAVQEAIPQLTTIPAIQFSLAVGAPDDPLEDEADRMADTVMRMPEAPGAHVPFVQRKCAQCEEEEEIQRKPLAASITPFIQTKIQKNPLNRRDRIHDPLLDEYARASGRPRDSVTQHDPGYEGWLQQSAAASNQATYNAAVALIQSRNAQMYNILRHGRIGQRVLARNFSNPVTGGLIPQTLNANIFLEISLSGVVAGAVAQFTETTPVITGISNPVINYELNLPIAVNPPSGANGATELAEFLYHEGVHMLLHLDRELASLTSNPALQSGMLNNFNQYMQWARASSRYAQLRAELDTAVSLFFAARPHLGATAANSLQITDTVIRRIIEEMFAIDQQIAQFPGSRATSSPVTIVTAYLDEYLAQEGVSLAGTLSTQRTRVATQMQFLLSDIQASRTAATSVPVTPPVHPVPTP